MAARGGMAASTPAAGNGSLAAALPRLTEETELQKMLADEKMRSEQHKTNYQTLKAEHTRLQDEYITLQSEMKTTIEESRLVQEKYKTLLEQARKDIASRAAENDDLKSQTLNAQKLEMIKIQVQEELEGPFREKFQLMEAEVEKYRNEYNKLKYEYSFLKAEYEHEKTENARIIEEMKMRHEAEITNIKQVTRQSLIFGKILDAKSNTTNSERELEIKVTNLRKERELVMTRYQSEGNQDGQRVRSLQRENAQLHLKLKGLLSELEEIRAQREHLGMQSDSVARLQTKQLAEHAANLKAVETERESLKMQVTSLQREISNNSEQLSHLTGKIHDLEKENIVLKNRAEEVTHKAKVEQTNLKMEMLRERGDLERERDRLLNEIEDLKSQIEISKHSASSQATALADKEREAVKRIQAAREEEWQKLHSLENDKMELETKLQEIERRRIDDESHRHAEREKFDDRLRQAQDAKEAAEKEALVYKTKVTHQESLLAQLERERSENSELKTRLHRIESQYQTYVSSEQEFIDTNDRLKNQVEQLREDLRLAREEISRLRLESDQLVVSARSQAADDKLQLQRRVDELDTQLTDAQAKLANTVTLGKKKRKKLASMIHKLKDRSSLQSAKIDQLKLEKEALKKAVPSDIHMQMKKQLRDLVRRHQEFRTVMLAGGNLKEVNIGDFSFASVGVPTEYKAAKMTYLDVADQHEKDLARLKERLDQLDDHQQYQMAELRQVSPIGSPRQKRATSPLRQQSFGSIDTDLSDRDTDKENVA